jgi:G8 domain
MRHALRPPPPPILALAALLIVCLCTTAVHAAPFTSVKSGAWSDPSTWGPATNARQLPGAGDDVVIAPGTTVTLDSSLADGAFDVALNTVSVQSRAVLTCPRNADLNKASSVELGLSTATLRIELEGCFSCGYGNCDADAEPFAGKFVLRLTSSTPPASTAEDVRTLVVESGGSLFLSGASRSRSVARLAQDVEAGGSILRIAGADLLSVAPTNQPWRVGDRVAIGPTDSFPSQTEYSTIVGLEQDAATSAAGASILVRLSDPLKYARNGRVLSLVNKADNNRQVTVDTRAEIALLSRNVVIEGTNDAVTGLGGDLMMAGDDVRARLSWVELRYLGRRGHLARYPLHIHNLGDSGRNVYVSNSVIHSSFQRGVVIHCTNGVTLVNNTVAGAPGFAYMLEDGAEENNTLIGNYAIDIKPSDYPLIQTERVNSAGFWFVNSANTFVGNVAGGIAGVGFSLDMDPVLNSRPASLTTCPERLPGYDAKLARENVTEFNRAVNTALIKKNFVGFADNTVHSAHSGLWMSYPFTPMFFVERPTPITRFTAWNIAARQLPSSLDSSDGVSLQFDGCIRLQGQRGMHIYQPTCVNSDSATWASCVSTFDGAIVVWVGSDRLKPSGAQRTAAAKSNGVMFTHLEPQIFLRTQVIAGPRPVQAGTAPLFATVSKGGPLAALNTLAGTVVDDAAVPPPPPLIGLSAGDMHVFTDATGDAFGAGPGAVVAATYFNASGVDPLIEAYAPGQCAAGNYASSRQWAHVSSSVLPNGRTVSVKGGLPVLCKGTGPALRFAGLTVELRGANWTRLPQNPTLEVGRAYEGVQWQGLRRVNSFPVMLPLNEASMHPLLGGYSLAFDPKTWTAAPSAQQMEVIMSSTIQASDAMTFVLTGLPAQAKVSKQQAGGAVAIVRDGLLGTCQRIIADCTVAKQANRSALCVCMAQDLAGTLFARIRATNSSPKNVGLFTSQGKSLSAFEFSTLRIDLV